MSSSDAHWTLIRTDTFLRLLRKYLRKHPDRRSLVACTLEILETDPHAPSLHLHALHGKMKGLHAVRLSHGDRIVLVVVFTEREIVLLSIGTHDEVYGGT
jgi:mRNA-degrading endonuclease YafQ of YafQ-DinJ toxin-antitoxin module